MKKMAAQLFLAGVECVLPDQLIQSHVSRMGEVLLMAGQSFSLSTFSHIYVIGAGKASASMAKGLEAVLGNRIDRGLVIVKYGHACALDRIEVCEAGHPVPDANGVKATEELMKLVRMAGETDLVICLISGGASALLADYPEGFSLDDLRRMNDLLLKSGADIREMNAVRKRFSKIKGGQLAKAIFPATSVSLILSDVVGDPVDVIASGPMSPDASTFDEAMQALERYHLVDDLPVSVIRYLQDGVLQKIQETPKADDPVFKTAYTRLIGCNKMALDAVRLKAMDNGFDVRILTSDLHGDLVKTADWLLAEVVRIQQDPAIHKPVCLLAGGELTIQVTGHGYGGRNQHLALYAATKIKGLKGVTFLSAGTDGTDGPTDAAGAVVDGETVDEAGCRQIDAMAYLEAFDSYHFFEQAGGHILTGPTMTNVMDLVIVLIEKGPFT